MAEERNDIETLLAEHVKSLLVDELCHTLPLHMHEAVRKAVDEFARDG